MGTSVTGQQVSVLRKLTRNIVLALDADVAGKEAILRGVSYENILEAEVRVMMLPEGKDPDDVIKENAETWPKLLAEAVPIMDYTFNIVAAKLDLTKAKDKSQAVKELLLLIAEMKDTIRQAHYIQKLARLANVSMRIIEAELSRIKPKPEKRRAQAPKQEVFAQGTRPLISSPREEYCLALLLQHPELKGRLKDLSPEYFVNSENREIVITWNQANDLNSLREKLDIAIHEHLDSLLNHPLPPNHIEQKYEDCKLVLKREYLRNIEARRAEVFALEAETKGAGADVVKLKEEGIEPALGLKEIDSLKARGGQN
jgi:DNA primase